MDEDTPSDPVAKKPSQVPSWVTLGFVLGALCVLAVPRPPAAEAPVRPVVDEAPPKPAKPPEVLRLTTIEAVFGDWDRYAVWSNSTTEVALWNSDTKGFTDFFEVMKNGEGYYFRSIPSLTRVPLTNGVPENSPLQFTETARQRQEWLDAVSRENWKAISAGARDALSPDEKKPPAGK